MQRTVICDITTPELAVEELYEAIKGSYEMGHIKREQVEALAELTTELANRLKEEEGGEQKD